MRWTAPVVLLGTACTPGASALRPLALDRPHMRPVTEFLDSAVAAGAAPGAVLGVSRADVRFVYGTGQLGADQPARPGQETIYDLASLTKVVGLVPAAMLAVDQGRLDLDASVEQYLPAFAGGDKSRVTIRMLLAHAGGLPAWRPLFREVQSRAEAFALADSTPLESPPGSTAAYSDLGTIILTQILEELYHERLDSLLQQRLFGPLGMRSTGYLPSLELRDRIAPTELDPWRGRVLQGEVHDENAAVMDGVSGHAGLFSSVQDLLTYGEWLVHEWHGAPALPGVDRSTVREFTRRQNLVPGSSRALGWDTPSGETNFMGRAPAGSFGHTGFTGTSLWIDPKRRLVIVLLSNRVNPTRNNPRWSPVRGAIADLVITTLYQDAQ